MLSNINFKARNFHIEKFKLPRLPLYKKKKKEAKARKSEKTLSKPSRSPKGSALEYRGEPRSTRYSITRDTCRTPTNRRACVVTHGAPRRLSAFFVDLAPLRSILSF